MCCTLADMIPPASDECWTANTCWVCRAWQSKPQPFTLSSPSKAAAAIKYATASCLHMRVDAICTENARTKHWPQVAAPLGTFQIQTMQQPFLLPLNVLVFCNTLRLNRTADAEPLRASIEVLVAENWSSWLLLPAAVLATCCRC